MHIRNNLHQGAHTPISVCQLNAVFDAISLQLQDADISENRKNLIRVIISDSLAPCGFGTYREPDSVLDGAFFRIRGSLPERRTEVEAFISRIQSNMEFHLGNSEEVNSLALGICAAAREAIKYRLRDPQSRSGRQP